MEQYQIDDMLSNLQSYLESWGINTRRHFRCLNPDHQDSNASMKYFDDNKCYCFGCGAVFNLVDCISSLENVDRKEAYKRAINKYSLYENRVRQDKPIAKKEESHKDYEKAYEVWKYVLSKNSKAKQYLKERGLSEETIKRFNLGFNSFDFGEFNYNAIVIPITNNCYTTRNIDKEQTEIRYYKSKGSKSAIFNSNALINEIPYCVITEGEFDCMSFETLGKNCIALCGANNIDKFISADKRNDKIYVLALDKDVAGIKTTNALKDYFDEYEMNYVEFDFGDYKDPNEALVKDREQFSDLCEEMVYDVMKYKERIDRKKLKQDIEM